MDNEMKGSLISIDEVKQLQLDVLDAIDKFCEENSIVYSMACGTMLGAVRHKGYIPWDDDIDIYLLREDYRILIERFPKVYKNYYELISLERDDNWDRPYAKAFDNRTIVEENANCAVLIGVNIDIYPIDDVPDDEKRWLQYNRRRRFYQKLVPIKYLKWSSSKSLMRNVLLILSKVPLSIISCRRLARFLSAYAEKNNGNGFCHVFECVQGMLQKNRFDKNLFNEIERYPFEDRIFKGFANSDEYLRNAYGDYMKFPPIDQQVSHHDFSAWWRK